MTPKRIDQRLADFERAFQRLEEALREDPAKSSAILDGTIQRFEFTFELAWKLMKDFLQYNGVEAGSPRETIKAAYAASYIEDGEGWIQMLEDRNKTSHLYDEKESAAIYKRIQTNYCKMFQALDKLIASKSRI